MGKGSGGGTNTIQTQSGPPPEILANYSKVFDQAQNVASQPAPVYDGSLIAGFTPMQQAAFNNINTAANAAQPYLNQAYANSLASTTALDPSHFLGTQGMYANTGINPYLDVAGGEINSAEKQALGNAVNLAGSNFGSTVGNYFNPYANSVIAPTQALFNEQNKEALNNVRGNAVSQGAFGGDREAIAEAETMRNQTLAQAPVLANLQSQGYQQAVQNAMQAAGLGEQAAGLTLQGAGARTALGNLQQNAFNSATSAAQGNAWLQSQGAFGMGSLGQEVQGLGLSGANAMLQAGGLQQQLAQQELNVPYQQWQAAQGYPYQITNWLEGMATGTGGMSGTQGSTTSPSPSMLSQLGGLGLSATGLIGATGGFGSGGWLTGALGGLFGGGSSIGAGASALTAADLGGGFLSDAAAALPALAFAKNGGRIAGFAHGGDIEWRDPGLTTSLGGVGAIDLGHVVHAAPRQIAGMGYDIGGAVSPAMMASFGGNPMMSGAMQQYADLPEEKLQELAVRFPTNPMVHRALMSRRMNPQGFAEGGLAMNDDAFTAAAGVPTADSFVTAEDQGEPSPFLDRIPLGIKIPNFSANIPDAPVAESPSKVAVSDAPPPPAPSDDNSTFFADQDTAPVAGFGSAPSSDHGPWGTILAAGLGMMSGTSPFAGVNIGKGGLEGLNYATEQKKLDEATALRRATIDSNNIYRQAMMGYRGDRLGLDRDKAGALADYRSRVLQLRDRGLSDKEAQDKATNEYRQGVLGERRDYHGATLSLGREKVDQAAARLANTQEYQQQSLLLRQQGMDAGRVSNIMNNATRMVAADITGKMTLQEAVRQQMGQRGSMGGSNSAPSVGGATAVNPQTGQRVRQQPDGSWAPIS